MAETPGTKTRSTGSATSVPQSDSTNNAKHVSERRTAGGQRWNELRSAEHGLVRGVRDGAQSAGRVGAGALGRRPAVPGARPHHHGRCAGPVQRRRAVAAAHRTRTFASPRLTHSRPLPAVRFHGKPLIPAHLVFCWRHLIYSTMRLWTRAHCHFITLQHLYRHWLVYCNKHLFDSLTIAIFVCFPFSQMGAQKITKKETSGYDISDTLKNYPSNIVNLHFLKYTRFNCGMKKNCN